MKKLLALSALFVFFVGTSATVFAADNTVKVEQTQEKDQKKDKKECTKKGVQEKECTQSNETKKGCCSKGEKKGCCKAK